MAKQKRDDYPFFTQKFNDLLYTNKIVSVSFYTWMVFSFILFLIAQEGIGIPDWIRSIGTGNASLFIIFLSFVSRFRFLKVLYFMIGFLGLVMSFAVLWGSLF